MQGKGQNQRDKREIMKINCIYDVRKIQKPDC